MHKKWEAFKRDRQPQVLEIRHWEANSVDELEDRVEEIFQKLREKDREVEI